MKFLITFGLFAIVAFSSGSAFACMCTEGKIQFVLPPLTDEMRKRLDEQTDYAVFIGEVIRIEKIKVKRFLSSNDKVSMKRVTVKVEKYWTGVKQTEMVIYTGIDIAACGVPYVRGKQYFFPAIRTQFSPLLVTDICSPWKVSEELIVEYHKAYGGTKTFP